MATDPAPPEPTIPCETCGYPTTMLKTKRCNRCFAVEGHLPEYVKTAAGRAFVEGVLGRAPGAMTRADVVAWVEALAESYLVNWGPAGVQITLMRVAEQVRRGEVDGYAKGGPTK